MYVYDPKYIMQMQKPRFPETEAQMFERLQREFKVKKKAAVRQQRIDRVVAVLERLGKRIRFFNNPRYFLNH